MIYKINGFIVSIETVLGTSHFPCIGLPQMEPTFITDEIFITPGHYLWELITLESLIIKLVPSTDVEKHGRTEILTKDEITCFRIL